MKRLYMNRRIVVSILIVISLICKLYNISYAVGVPTLESAESNTELRFRFVDSLAERESKSYHLDLRKKTPQGEWQGTCHVAKNRENRPVNVALSLIITDLEPNTTYQARYRHTNLRTCAVNPVNPGPWSRIVEGTTTGGPPFPEDDEQSSKTVYAPGEDILTLPVGEWTPDSHNNGGYTTDFEENITVQLSNRGWIEEEGVTYTCITNGGCKIENRRVVKGMIHVTGAEEPISSDPQQTDTPEQTDDRPLPTTDSRTAFESSKPAGYTRVTLNDRGTVWGVPTRYTTDSDHGAMAYMLLGKLKGCSFINTELAQRSKVYIKTQALGRLTNYASETVCGISSSRWTSSWDGVRITHIRYYDENSLPNIQEAVYDASTGQYELTTEPKRLPDDTKDVSLPESGKMYWTNGRPAYKIQCANLDGTNIKHLVAVMGWPEAIALDISDGKMYWTVLATSKIQRANLDGTDVEDLVTGADGLVSPDAIALDVSGGKMYWTDWTTDKIQRANLDGTDVDNLLTSVDGLLYPSDIVLDVSDGKMYWTDSKTGKIQRANLDGTNIKDVFRTSSVGLDAIALDVSNDKIYWTDSSAGKIQRANLDGSNVEDLVTTGLDNPNGITLDVSGGKIYWTDAGAGKIQRANLDGSNVEDLVTNLSYPEDIKLYIPMDAEITETPVYLKEDVNRDSVVNILDLVLVANDFGQSGEKITDINDDNIVNILDLVRVAGAFGKGATAPSLYAKDLSMLTASDVKLWLSQAQQLNLTDATSLRGVQFLEQLLVALIPKETALLPNYPNPFNPETWIPYQIAKPSEVTITIYDIRGRVVRTLILGTQPAGVYRSRSKAAYWDGRNASGEPVASGVYFYTLTAGDFTATRKMLIMK